MRVISLFLFMCLPFLALTFLSVYVFPFSEIFVAAVMAEIFLAMILWILLHAGIEYRRLGLKNITITLLDIREGASGKEKFYACELLVDNMNSAAKKINVENYVRNAVWFYGKGRSRLKVKKCAFQSLPLPTAQTRIVCEIVIKKNAALQRLRLLSGGALVNRDIGEAAGEEKTPARIKPPKEARGICFKRGKSPSRRRDGPYVHRDLHFVFPAADRHLVFLTGGRFVSLRLRKTSF